MSSAGPKPAWWSAHRLAAWLGAESTPDQKWLQATLLLFSFCHPFSNALAEGLIFFVGLPVWLYGLVRRRDSQLLRNPFFWPLVLYVVIAVGASFLGVRPAYSLWKCNRLLLLALVFMVCAALRNDNDWARKLALCLGLFVIGCCLQEIRDLVRILVRLARGMALSNIQYIGDEHSAQRCLVALCFLLAALAYRTTVWRKSLFGPMLMTCGLGLIIQFKRGAWLAFLLASGIIGLLARKYRLVMAVVCGAAALLLLLLSPLQSRITRMQDEFSVAQGRRYALWTQVAPVLIPKYPFGMGFKGSRYEDFLAVCPAIEPRLDHLHNNVLSIALETGWAGLAVWLWWMIVAGVVFWKNYRHASQAAAATTWMAVGTGGAFCGLWLNGLVEYNFSDSRILMTFAFLMGIAACLWDRQPRSPAGLPPFQL